MTRVGLLAVLVVACAGNPGLDLSVDLRTDYVAGGDFNTIVVTLPGEEPVRVIASSFEDYLRGARVAEFGGLTASDFRVTVDLLSNAGTVVASRSVLVQLRADLAITVVITQSCRGVVCPNGSDANATECVGGICVNPGCTPETPDLCPPTPACVTATECPAPAQTCLSAQCIDGFCLYGDDGSCGMGRYCNAERGCEQRPMGDASVPDGGGDAGVDAMPDLCGGVVCEGFSICDMGTCRDLEGCFTEADCPGEFPLCRNNHCVPPDADIDGDGSPARDDCDETNPDISPLAPERCNLIDDDCNDMVDDGNPGVLCAAEGGECIDGVCGCPPNQYDIDGVPETGCECTSEPATGVATACADAQDLGALSDAGAGQTTTIMGNVVPGGREVWYRFRGVDSPDTTCDNYHVRVQFTANPDDAYRFVVYRGDCATSLCPDTGFTDFSWATDFRDAMGNGECPCSPAPQGAPGQNSCSDDSVDFFVQVVRRAGAPIACDAFTLELSNGAYDTP